MSKVMRILLSAIIAVLLASSLCFAAQKQTVSVADLYQDKVVIKTSAGKFYELRLGKGCAAIKHYKNKNITIEYSGKFLEKGSSILLAKEHQQCSVTKLREVKPAAPKKAEPKKPDSKK